MVSPLLSLEKSLKVIDFVLISTRCNAYNISSAAACLLCVTFGVSIFFDVQDLHSSKQSPRTRT